MLPLFFGDGGAGGSLDWSCGDGGVLPLFLAMMLSRAWWAAARALRDPDIDAGLGGGLGVVSGGAPPASDEGAASRADSHFESIAQCVSALRPSLVVEMEGAVLFYANTNGPAHRGARRRIFKTTIHAQLVTCNVRELTCSAEDDARMPEECQSPP